MKRIVQQTFPIGALFAWRRFKAHRLIVETSRRPCLANRNVDLTDLRFFRHECFPESGPRPWLDRPDAEQRIEEKLAACEIDAQQAELCRFWREHGYLHLEAFFDSEFLEGIWSDVETAVESGDLPVTLETMVEGGPWEGRFQDLHLRVPSLAGILHHEAKLALIGLLLGYEIRPFQTIVFFAGSEQAAHQDQVHMTTYPLGYLVGSWTAMEDIQPDSGPLTYYPGSHRLPYVSAQEVGVTHRESLFDFYTAYHGRYEPHIQELIEREGLEPVIHTPKQGDLLLWHANLLHGGSPRQDTEQSRKSVVCHYLAREVVCYHDVSASLARSE